MRLVHVNWSREPGDSAVDNPMWDTHAQNADRLQDCLCPQFDVSFAALMDDLQDRGLLAETLVVVIGEFGRTPRINAQGGRDHWGHVFSMAMAGAGIRGGQVIGASDKNGAYPATDPIRGGDLTATIFHLLGIDPAGMFMDKTNRPHPISRGEPIRAMLGIAPATEQRQIAEGDPVFVPPYDTSLLLDTGFTAALPLIAATPASRAKGWRGFPLTGGLAVQKADGSAVLGYGLSGEFTLGDGERCLLAQEIRNARGGQYTFRATVSGAGASADEFEKGFLANLTCRLVLFRFRNINKDPHEVDELASMEFRPAFGKTETFTVDRFLGSTTPGANFAIGQGLGVAIVVRRLSVGRITRRQPGFVRIHSVTLNFQARPRDENVTV